MAPQSSSSGGAVKARQLVSSLFPFSSSTSNLCADIDKLKKAHLHSQLSQLSSNLSDTENLLRMTAVQAEAMRGLGAWHGGM